MSTNLAYQKGIYFLYVVTPLLNYKYKTLHKMLEQKDKIEIARVSHINVKVGLDETNVPVSMKWQASDSPYKNGQDCKAMMLSIWDEAAKQSLRIDLWTKEMTIEEMQFFFFETLMTMSGTYLKATNDAEMSEKMKLFARDFAIHTKIHQKK